MDYPEALQVVLLIFSRLKALPGTEHEGDIFPQFHLQNQRESSESVSRCGDIMCGEEDYYFSSLVGLI